MAVEFEIINTYHPFYVDNQHNWYKWRKVYEGGDIFIRMYLKTFSQRESSDDFRARKEITYCPAFATAGINEVRNSIFQRLVDVTREGGPSSYQRAVIGLDGGVDKRSSSLNSYLGLRTLKELLVMGRVGLYVDMPRDVGTTLVEKTNNIHPYIYEYRAEQIRSWTYDPEDPEVLTSVLLEEEEFDIDETTGLTKGIISNYRHMWINGEGTVSCLYYNQAGQPLGDGKPIILELDRIPFILLELSSSLMANVANYQIALLNLESSDLLYALRSNFPFYTEQFDPRTESGYLKPPGRTIVEAERTTARVVQAAEKVQEVSVGINAGRRYPLGTERPQFIHPSSEPLKVSMEKEEQIKRDIRLLINLSIQNLEPRRSSAPSKIADERSLESGLSYIGLELERAEQQIAWFWSKYEGSDDVATIKYPENYELKTEADKKDETEQLIELIPKIASNIFRKEAMKRIVDLTIANKIPYKTLQAIKNEIDGAPVVYADPKDLTMDLENGLAGLDTVSKARGYPEGEVEKAAKDHAEKLKRIAIAQMPGMGARGIPELASDPKEGKLEKQNAREVGNLVPSNNGRGEGK